MSIGLSQISECGYVALQKYHSLCGLPVMEDWKELTLDEQNWWDATVKSLTERVKGPDVGAMAIFFHNAVAARYLRAGWTHGETFNRDAKITPYMMPLEELGKADQAARFLFCSVVSALQFAR